jgi:hypothetical protein
VKRTRIVALVALATSLSVSACARPAGPSRSGGLGQRLTQADLEKTTSEVVYDAVVKLRPEWLSSRGPTSVTNSTPTSVDVFMNGNNMGSAEYLKDLRVIDIVEVRFYNAGQASARFGMGHPRGVLEIIHK